MPIYSILRESIEIPSSPVLPSESTMPKFRIIIEDEKTGQEYQGFSGLNRIAVQRIVALVNSVGQHELMAGQLPKGHPERVLQAFAVEAARKLDRKPPKPAPPRQRRGVYARKPQGR